MTNAPQLQAVFLHLGYIQPRVGWHLDAHVHEDYHQLIMILNGTIETEIRGKRLRGRRGDLLYYPRGEWHAERSAGDEVLEICYINWEGGDPEAIAHWPLNSSDTTGRTQVLGQWMRELFPPTQPRDSHMIDLLLNALLFGFERSAQTREQEMVQRIKSYIQKHLSEAVTLEALAREAGLSKFHFSREFKKATGVSPIAFLRRMRVEAARALLLSTSWPLKVIASQVGFADEFQLSRVFRRLTGTAPKSVRQTLERSAPAARDKSLSNSDG